MASSGNCNGSGGGGSGGEDDAEQLEAKLSQTLKEGERILAPTRRPDGTLRKPIRIRAGYVPQDEVAIYQSRGALWKKEMASLQEAPPGYDPAAEAKPKTKSAKRNERKKEKRQQQASLEKNTNLENNDISAEDANDVPESEEAVASQMNALAISENPSVATPPNSTECLTTVDDVQVIDKKIRALKKKLHQKICLFQTFIFNAATLLWRAGPPNKPVLCNDCGLWWKINGTLEDYSSKHVMNNAQSSQTNLFSGLNPTSFGLGPEITMFGQNNDAPIWDPSNVSRKKRSTIEEHVATPSERLHQQLYPFMEKQLNKDEEDPENVLIFERINKYIPENEIGLGCMLLKPSPPSPTKDSKQT